MIRQKMFCFWLALAVAAVWARPVAAVDLQYGPTSLTFNTFQGTNPSPQVINTFPSDTGTVFNPKITASTNNGSNWLSTSTSGGATFSSEVAIFVSVNSQNLAPGTYTGQVQITHAGLARSPGVVAVTLNVFASGPSYVVSQPILEVSTTPGQNAPASFLTVTTLGGSSVNPTVTSTTSGGGNWIAVAAPIASTLTPGTTVQVNYPTASMAAGFYSGVITISGAGIKNSPVNIPVNLTVGTAQGPAVAANPNSISFNASPGANPSPVTLAINNSGQGTIAPTVASYTSDGSSWLSASLSTSPPGQGGSTTATVSVDTSRLTLGNYSGTVVIMDPSVPNGQITVPVTLSLTQGSPVLKISNKSMLLTSPPGGSAKITSTVDVSNSGTGAFSFSATATTSGGGNWLSVTPSSGSAPQTITITADPTGLATGNYTGQVTVTIPNAPAGAQSPQTIAVTFAVGQNLPSVSAGGIVNGASFTSQVVAAGEIVSAFGANLGPSTGLPASATGNFLPTAIAGIQVTFDGTPAPFYYASQGQLNLQVPFEVAGKSSTVVQVTANSLPGAAYTLQLRPADPAIFVTSNGRMAILDLSGQQITTGHPASPGQVLTIYATGLGQVSPAIPTGELAPLGTLFNTPTLAGVSVAGQAASVSFSGLAPTFCGLYQVNFTVPAGLSNGDQALILSIGGQQTVPLPLAVKANDVSIVKRLAD